MKESVVLVEGVKKVYGSGRKRVEALRGVDMEVKGGELVAIMGPSGAGKTTLLNIISGIEAPTEGKVTVRGIRVDSLNERERRLFRRVNIGYVFQNYNLIPSLNALENVLLPSLFSEEDLSERAMELLKMVGLQGRWDHLPGELSGGERQRVALARALLRNPPLILADEPTGNIDTTQAGKLMRILRRIAREGKAIIVATHDPVVASSCHRVLRLRDGKMGGRM
ncbi:lipoprotein-releasing system ATP-binding protein LolD [Thermoplasmatales archaeon ex4484_36]|nr:MAG: lipoprotein-releasing system ATP-binding protein LolD [Thermoplasmatales archaeon ex4484_36]RLF70397.1 MAG: lipoprotein-releasing system ATP-binding protein LolD [Thermoplasmata archaeon]